jgi:hypothetical protein
MIMKNLHLLVISIASLMMMFPMLLKAQNDVRITGTIVDEGGKAIKSASVIVKQDSMNYACATTNKGIYDMTVPKTDSIEVTFSCIGYETVTEKIRVTGAEMRRDVTLREKGKELEGVTVTGKGLIRGLDVVSYIPNKRQVNSSNSGVGLLSSLMIPQLDVDRISGSIASFDKRTVSIYIDGRETGISEVSDLRPKDIQRVEFHQNPTGKYSGKQLVLNFITRKYDYGGYVDIRTDTRFLYRNGSYQATVSVDRKKMNYTFSGGSGFSIDKGIKSENEEYYAFSNPFNKTSESVTDKMKNYSDYGYMKVKYKDNKTFFYFIGGFNWNNTPTYTTTANLNYTPTVDNAKEARSESSSKSVAPMAYFFLQKNLPKMQFLIGTLGLNYNRNKYNRMYNENMLNNYYLIESNANEDKYKIDFRLQYYKYFKHSNNFSLLLWSLSNFSKTDYKGTYSNVQNLFDSGTQLYPTYSQTFFNRLNVSLQLGASLNYYRVKDFDHKCYLHFRPRINLSYAVNDFSSLYFQFSIGSTSPELSKYNSAVQQVDRFMQLKGNPNLKDCSIYEGHFSYSVYVKNWSSSLYTSYYGVTNVSKSTYYPSDSMIIHTYLNDGNFHMATYGISNSFNLLNNSLRLQFNVSFRQMIMNGNISAHTNYYSLSGKVSYYIGNFSFEANYMSPSKSLNTVPFMEKHRENYGLLATYGYKGLYMEIGAKNIFQKNVYEKDWFDFSQYRYCTRNYSDAIGRQIYVELSYSFDFGRKIKKQDVNVNNDNSSGILKI